MRNNDLKQIGLLGGGPAALFMYKRLIESGENDFEITIIEKSDRLGAGMPYSSAGANPEHITNVSGNEIPEILPPVKDWIKHAAPEMLKQFDMKPELFNDYKVMPRLLFGEYLEAQFTLLRNDARRAGISTKIIFNTTVIDIADNVEEKEVTVYTKEDNLYKFDQVVICTGHNWPKKFEGKISNWFDSPYPPHKLDQKLSYPVAIKGSSLTAIDAVRTLARSNGTFSKNEENIYSYELHKGSEGFRLVMHSLGGFLPAIRFHLEDTHLSLYTPLTAKEVYESKAANGGFIPLDYIFERIFKQPIKDHNPEFYNEIKDLSIETFVDRMMSLRESLDAFELLKAELAEADRSIKRQQSVFWKEMLGSLSYAMNYPAKHLSAEDMIRLKKVLMPLISIVIAYIPQSSCRELLALYDAGVLSLVSVDKDSIVEPAKENGAIYHFTGENGQKQTVHYNMFIDAVGQPPFMFKDFPFEGLIKGGTMSAAHLQFKSADEGAKEKAAGNPLITHDSLGNYFLQVPGININDAFQVLDKYGVNNTRVYIMAVPYIAGLNPDYSGLDFCETASERIIKTMLNPEAAPVDKLA